jgi:hypothetical protein
MQKTFKQLDLLMQVLIFLVCLTRALWMNEMTEMVWAYFILGGWQLLSFGVHYFVHTGWKNQSGRQEFGRLLGWIGFLFIILYLLHLLELPLMIFFMMGMLFAGPAMAIWYFLIGCHELKNIRHRELIHLK